MTEVLAMPPRKRLGLFHRAEAISHERAKDAALRLVHSHFGTLPHARIHIPADCDDDDIVLLDYIQQQMLKEMGLDR